MKVSFDHLRSMHLFKLRRVQNMANSIKGHRACDSIVRMIVVPTIRYQAIVKSGSVPTKNIIEAGPSPPSKSLKLALFITIKTAVLIN